MEHYYTTLFHQWFNYPELYTHMVNVASESAHFVEVGSWKGASAAYMAVEIINSGKKIKFDCIDTWKGSEEHNMLTPAQQEKLYIEFIKNIKPVSNVVNHYRIASSKAVEIYEDSTLDFVFIDAAHDYANVLFDIISWYPKVKKGGYIGGHDYHSDWPDVAKAVHSYFKNEKVLTNLNEHTWLYRKL